MRTAASVINVDLGGLSALELIRRTIRESWEDAVFGQGGRMAFYHFLAIFPALLVLRVAAQHIGGFGNQLSTAAVDTCRQILPNQVADLVARVFADFAAKGISGPSLLPSLGGALWAACNGTWALIYGLNTAYEVKERRRPWQLALTIAGLTLALASVTALAIATVFAGVRLAHFAKLAISLHVIEWVVLGLALLLAFAVVYRFAPNLRNPRWRWSTPGALTALVLWIVATVGARYYFEHIDDYSRPYGHLNGVVMLLLWLYVTNGALLIGGEMNSEIEKHADGDAKAENQRRAGGRS